MLEDPWAVTAHLDRQPRAFYLTHSADLLMFNVL